MPLPGTHQAKSCWIVTENLIGLQNQAQGLAERLGLLTEVKLVQEPGFPWRFLPPYSWPSTLGLELIGMHPAQALQNWPDVLISVGKRSIASSLAVRKWSHGKTFTIHVQDPRMKPSAFDAIIVASHDKIRGENVYVAQGALNHVTQKKLEDAALFFSPLLAHLPRPILSVLVGGDRKRKKVGMNSMRVFGAKLSQLAKETGGSLAITPSRRTGKHNEIILRESIKGIPTYIWDGKGHNPYFGLLALADYIIVTSDSISMISEACSTGKPVYIYNLKETEGKRHRQFHKDLIEKGCIRHFYGQLEKWHYMPLNDTKDAANFVNQIMLAKMTRHQ